MTEDAFGQVVQQYEKLVYTICYQFTRHPQTAEDLTQEAFLAAFRHWDSCPEENRKPWLARIATNKAKDHLKSAYHRRVFLPGEEGLPETGSLLVAADALPQDAADSQEGLEAIRQQVLALKEPYHQVARLYFLEECSVEEIAHRLGRPAKTVHTQLYRAKKLLQQALAPRAGSG